MAGKQARTVITVDDPAAFLALLEPPRRADGEALDALFRRATGFMPRMWGPAIIGYGAYSYRYESGHSGESLAVGFSPRSGKFALYCMPPQADATRLLPMLGKYKQAKSCIYISRLSDIHTDVLEQAIRASIAETDAKWGVRPT